MPVSASVGFPVVVAIPVRNEEARIAACLTALAGQRGARADAVVLLLNNCTDGTAAAVASMAAGFPAELVVIAQDFPAGQANAGLARSLAMDAAAERAGPAGVVLTTDADGRVAPDWLARNLRALSGGADAVAGRAIIDPVEALLIPQALHDDDARECAYAAVLDEIAAHLDPDPYDPWPRHTEESGASLAVTVAVYRAVGGLPRVRVGEDRAFAATLRRHDARLRHAPDVWATVSGRIEGQAEGGMADTIRRRMIQPDEFLDDRLEPAADAARRSRLRHRARRVFRAGGDPAAGPLGTLLGLSPELVGTALTHTHFGAAWEAIEAASPWLARRRVPVADLPGEMRTAESLLAALRPPAGATTEARRADTGAAVAS